MHRPIKHRQPCSKCGRTIFAAAVLYTKGSIITRMKNLTKNYFFLKLLIIFLNIGNGKKKRFPEIL